jgi:hypothetical protein
VSQLKSLAWGARSPRWKHTDFEFEFEFEGASEAEDFASLGAEGTKGSRNGRFK